MDPHLLPFSSYRFTNFSHGSLFSSSCNLVGKGNNLKGGSQLHPSKLFLHLCCGHKSSLHIWSLDPLFVQEIKAQFLWNTIVKLKIARSTTTCFSTITPNWSLIKIVIFHRQEEETIPREEFIHYQVFAGGVKFWILLEE